MTHDDVTALTATPLGATAYLAAEEYLEPLLVELGDVRSVHGRLVIADGPPRPAAWAQNIWYDPVLIPIQSIKQGAKALRGIQRNWALYGFQHHRRAQLIQDNLPHVSAKPVSFFTPPPTAPLGSWTLLNENTILAAAHCSSPYRNGEIELIEDKVTPPNRAYLKLWEAFTRIGYTPKPGEQCIDLGACPGGWTWVMQKGATMFKDGDRYIVVASEVTGRMRAPTEDVFMATGPTPYGPFSRRFLAVPHAGRTSVLRDKDGGLWASYNPQCADHLAHICEQVGLVPLTWTESGRLRPAASVLTENSPLALARPALPEASIRDPSVTMAADGSYYLVGTTSRNRETDGVLALWRSGDMKEWTETSLSFDRDGLGVTFRNIAALWAPEIKWVARDRTFYLAFSMMERDVGGRTWLYRSTSGRAEGPYRNVAKANLVTGIDGFIFEDGDDLYLLWGGGNLGKLNARRDGFEEPPVRLLDTDGEKVGYEGNGLVRVGDTYFITGAEWNGPLRTHGTYDMMYGAARSVLGPYSKRQVGAPHAGHGTLFQDQSGHWWTTMFGNDVTAPYRKRFGLVPLRVDGERIMADQLSGTIPAAN